MRGPCLAHLFLAGFAVLSLASTARSEGSEGDAAPTASTADAEGIADEERARAKETAVALNYCRAAFHRIRKEPTKAVLAEEQEKILNNLNLDRVCDPEIIQLYTSVLDEIGQIGIADTERKLYREHHSDTLQKTMTWSLLAIGADAASGQFGNVVRNGANSWWDYRNLTYQKDSDLLKIEKTRMSVVVQKSSQFMDTFWRMAQKRKIPDRWLVRGDDLDALDDAMREADAEVRLRILKRMEPFMEAYPPYWYYLARTQQQLGQFFAAGNTYLQVVDLGDGHFRKDDMLATGLANRAAIQDYLGQAGAVETAQRALDYSTEAWEANLICARILERNQRFADAEDAILRNLDVDLETAQSRVFLTTLYIRSQDNTKLAALLRDPQAVAGLPAPVLLRCAALLGRDSTPPEVVRTVLASLIGEPRLQFGPDDFVLKADNSWQLHLASMSVWYNGQELPPTSITGGNGYHALRYAARFDWGTPLGGFPADMKIVIQMKYPDDTQIKVVLEPPAAAPANGASALRIARTSVPAASFRISEVLVDETKIALNTESSTSPAAGTQSLPVNAGGQDSPATEYSAAKPAIDIPIDLPAVLDVPLD